MKKNFLGMLATVAVCGLVAVFAACSSSDSNDEPITDNNAGEFKIVNATRGNADLTVTPNNLFKGDVLKIQFSPKYKKNYTTSYAVSVNGGTKTTLEGNEFTVSEGNATYTFTLIAKYDEGATHLSATKTITVKQEYNVTVPYVLYITEDLKDLIKVNVDFSNEAGKTYPMEDLPSYTFEEHQNVWTYEDGGLTHYTFNEPEAKTYDVHAGPLTAKTVPMLVINLPYYRFNIDTEIILTYKQKADVIETQDYNIGRSFERKKASVLSPTAGASDKDWRYTVPMFTGELKTGKETKKYVDQMVKEKDVIKLHIDADGNVTERK